ncbi:hypothetical protein, partial [Bacillus swezeyi]
MKYFEHEMKSRLKGHHSLLMTRTGEIAFTYPMMSKPANEFTRNRLTCPIRNIVRFLRQKDSRLKVRLSLKKEFANNSIHPVVVKAKNKKTNPCLARVCWYDSDWARTSDLYPVKV